MHNFDIKSMTNVHEKCKQESLADAKVSVRQQYVYKGP